MVGKLGALVLEKELGWDGVEGCTAMLVVMSTDVDKEVQAECKQTPRYRSSKQSLKIAIKKNKKRNLQDEMEDDKMVGYDDGEDKAVDDVALQDRQNVIVVDMVVRESGLWPISMNYRYPPHDECGILKAG